MKREECKIKDVLVTEGAHFPGLANILSVVASAGLKRTIIKGG